MSQDVLFRGLQPSINRFLLPGLVSEPWRKKSEKSGKSRKSGGFFQISGERIGVKSPSTHRFSLCTGLRVHAKFEPDRSSRCKVYYGEMHAFLYVRVRYGRPYNFSRKKKSELVFLLHTRNLIMIFDLTASGRYKAPVRPDTPTFSCFLLFLAFSDFVIHCVKSSTADATTRSDGSDTRNQATTNQPTHTRTVA